MRIELRVEKVSNHKNKTISFFILLSLITLMNSVLAQDKVSPGAIHGNFQGDAQYYNPDSNINAPLVPEKMLMNGYANFNYESEHFLAGLRYESYLHVLQGFDPRYEGSGIMYRYLTYKKDQMEITAGSFYEQFGSGMVLRAYEERGLGIDNALEGFRVKYTPIEGLTFKGVIGKQRSFFNYGPGIVRGFDGELSLNDFLKSWSEKKTKIVVGGCFVSKYQKDADPIYILPENVGSYSGRINLQHGKISFNSEYAYKINDPSFTNHFIYKDGQCLLVSATYTKPGIGLTISGKRTDNMNYRSDRTVTGTLLNINFLPALTKQHTYQLATFYPYATQPNGEMAGSAEFFYNFKPGSTLGGKHGMNLALNFSKINSIDTVNTNNEKGYTSNFLKIGKTIYFEDLNVELTKKFSKKYKMIFTYLNIIYNKNVIQGEEGIFHANIGVIETIWKMTDKVAMRTELQHLYTKQDQGNWLEPLVEFSFSPHWFVSAYDLYNYGNEIKDKQIHYFGVSTGYTKNAVRMMLSYGKQRAGLFCVGGVCRTVPASNGVSFSITSSF